MPLQRCVPKGAHTDEFTFTGTADAPGFCPIAVGGTLKANDINMSWVDGAPCGGESSTFTGSLKWGQGTGSGDFTDNLFGPGTWTATRTS